MFRSWITIFFLSIVILISFNMFVNYYTNPNHIFTKKIKNDPLKCFTYYGGPNERFLKINHILANKEKYNSFIFGSSRVGKMNMYQIKGSHFYNMTYGAGYPAEHLSIIKLFLKNNVKIKEMWIGLDDFSYAIPKEQPYTWSLSRPHWKMKFQEDDNIFKFYSFYLLKLVSLRDLEVMFNRLINKKMDYYLYDIYGTGMPLSDKNNRWIEKHKEEHNNDKKFLSPYVFAEENHVDSCINDLKDIIKICKQNNISLKIFLNPLHKVTYLNDNFELFTEFKEKLANITDYYDFAYLNNITTNNYYYFETSHYRNIVGDMIIKSIIVNDNKFGKYITKDNFHEHKKFLINNLAEY